MLRPTKSQFYYATIADEGCKVKDSIRIVVDTLTSPQLINDTTLCKGQVIQLSKQSNAPTMSYQWTPTTLLHNPTQLNATTQVQKTVQYIVLAQSANGYCHAQDSVLLSLYEYDTMYIQLKTESECNPEEVILIPTVFLPDGTSDDNKEFGISLPENIGTYSLFIYNRWGNLIYQTTEGKPCKGNNPDGSPALSDVYLYRIEVPTRKGKASVVKKGDVTLLR